MDSDDFILEKYRNINTKHYGFNLLLKKYQKKVYWHTRRMVIDHEDANDITQDVFIKIWNKLDNFRGDSELYTWIYRIATNECLNFLSKKKRRFFLPLVNVENELSKKIQNDTYINGDDIQKKLQNALLKLPEKQRLIFNMKYYDDMKYEKISKILDTSVGALKASYHIAVKKIEKFLKED